MHHASRSSAALAFAALVAVACAVQPAPTPGPTVAEQPPPAPPTPPEPATPAPEADPDVVAWARVAIERERDGFPWARASGEFAEHITLPRSSMSEPMVMAPLILIARDGVYLDGRRLARVEAGALVDLDPQKAPLIAALHEQLGPQLQASAAAASRFVGPKLNNICTLLADASTPFSVLVAVIYTAGQADASHYQIVVAPPGAPRPQGTDVLQIVPPKFSVRADGEDRDEADNPEKLQMIMHLSPTHVRIGRHVPHSPKRSAWLETIDLTAGREPALRRITALARKLHAEEKWDRLDSPNLRFGADATVTLDLLVAALAAASGPECDLLDLTAHTDGRCLFTYRVIHGGSPAPPELEGR